MNHTGHTFLFTQFVSNNYKKLSNDAQRIFYNESDYEDNLQDNLLKIYDRIKKSGFTGNNYYGYLWLSLSNNFKLKKKERSRKVIRRTTNHNELHVDDLPNVEQHLIAGDLFSNNQQYYDDLEVMVRYLFKYLDLHYPEQKSFLFKTYYMTSNNTYSKLVANSSYKYSTVKVALSKMKKDIRTNFINWFKFEMHPEQYRPVKHYEKLYEVSNKGQVRSLITGQSLIANEHGNYILVNNNGVEKEKSTEQLTINIFKPKDIIIFKRIMPIKNRK